MINQQSNKQALIFPPADAQYDHPIKTLIGSLISAITRYDCAIEDPSCQSWRALKLSVLLARGKVNCDEVPDNKICMDARKLLGDEDASDAEIRKGLKDQVFEGVKNQEQMSKLKGVFAGVRDYVCWRQSDMEYCVK